MASCLPVCLPEWGSLALGRKKMAFSDRNAVELFGTID